MFSSTLKLFSQVACPDENCARSPCLFSHHEQHRTAPPQAGSASNRSTAAGPASRAPPAKPLNLFIPRNTTQRPARPVTSSRNLESAKTTRAEPSATPITSRGEQSSASITAFDMARGLTAQSSKSTSKPMSSAVARGAGISHSAVSSGPSRAPPVPAQTKTSASGMLKRPNKRPTAFTTAPSGQASERLTGYHAPKPPVLIASGKLSKQPIVDRQRALRKLFDEYCRLYAKINSLDPDLPASTALRQEQDTAGVTNKHSYSQAIHNVLIELRQRPLPESLDSPHVGTIQESREKVRLDEERRNSAITVDRVAPYVIPLSRLEQWGFITHVPDEPGDTEPEAIGQQETCDRCHDKFTVSDEIDYAGFTRQAGRGECVYHWGKLAPARQEGTKVWLWSCCGESRHSEGCVDGLHVFRDGYPFGHVLQPGEVPEEVLLHRRKAFKTTKQVIEERRAANGQYGDRKRKVEETFDIVALDCEMINTTAGITLGRLSVLNAEGELILDRCVRQTATILDLNTRFSGLSVEDIANATHDLEATKSELCTVIDENTIIIGHGLDNDLKALRLVHTRIIDTAIMYPHEKGPPYRRALKDVLSEKVGTFIQNNILEEGHDSSADARAALDLVKWRVKLDVATGLAQ